MNRLLLFLITLSCAALITASARADPYWISYEGNDFPENEGWTRTIGAGGAERYIEDGTLVLDGRQDIMIADSYSMQRLLDPEPGELFIMRWRLNVDELTEGHSDAIAAVFSDESWAVAFRLSESRIFNSFDLSMSAPFEQGAFHLFELRSWDMRTFELSIDDAVALSGDFVHVITASKVAWGDGVQGAASLSRWDCFEFGVVPEPTPGVVLGVAGTLVFIRRRAF